LFTDYVLVKENFGVKVSIEILNRNGDKFFKEMVLKALGYLVEGDFCGESIEYFFLERGENECYYLWFILLRICII
jgi:hypothetical protein